MRRTILIALAALSLSVTGCKDKAVKLQELQQQLAAAQNLELADCPAWTTLSPPPNPPKCAEDKKRAKNLNEQVQTAQRDLANQ
jgi:hypothetical protein